ncbi:HNH endonuclease [Clostridium sp. HBUAS56010]|uniref:HNH endonuclease n=1 Tax=Clostridium sp. HBUAS56010 TaxID=2571127 RepID=UPI001177AAAA|nr:HNH endonuclease [Clostridium sp. HBUAS56010]
MYAQIIDELNNYLRSLNISDNPVNPDEFQAIFVKKLSNQNIIKDKRRINAGATVSTVNQTHLDITGRQSMLFFFESLNDETTSIQNIAIDLFETNYKYLNDIDIAQKSFDTDGNTCFVRSSVSIPPHLSGWNKKIYSSAYKKYGHTGDQIQINIPDSDEIFTKFHHLAFQDDALVLLKYDYFHYLAIIIPFELCDILYSITNTHGYQNVNVTVDNPFYNRENAKQIQFNEISQDLMYDEVDLSMLQNSLINSPTAGTDIPKLIKTRISQGAFRRLLLLERHQCLLCDVTTTSVLRASHIKEWSESSREERIDAANGLLLCANHDALFDRHLISFNPKTGNICISDSISVAQKTSLRIPDRFNLSLNDRMKNYMKIHYQKYKENES